jgi:hypothetical protein
MPQPRYLTESISLANHKLIFAAPAKLTMEDSKVTTSHAILNVVMFLKYVEASRNRTGHNTDRALKRNWGMLAASDVAYLWNEQF